MSLKIIILITFVFAYLLTIIIYYKKNKDKEKAFETIEKKEIYLFPWEKYIKEKLNINKKSEKIIFYSFRIILVAAGILVGMQIGALALAFICAIIIICIMNNKNKKLVSEIGIEYIEIVNAFLDSYVPALASGLSNDQAMLKYLNSINNEELFDWWLNKENHTVQVSNKYKRIVEIYEMMKFNEDHGIDNTLPIIEQMQKDLNQKQQYYNEFLSKMGEIKPILGSYYVCVPLLTIISFSQTKDFWFSIQGVIGAIVIVLLFLGSQFCVQKIREKTVKTMF